MLVCYRKCWRKTALWAVRSKELQSCVAYVVVISSHSYNFNCNRIERPRGGEKTVGTVVSVSIHVHNI